MQQNHGEQCPKTLYHVKRTIINWHHDKSGVARSTSIRGTFSKLSAAKAAARNCLFDEGYERDWFESLETNISERRDEICGKPWRHGSTVVERGVADSGDEFLVSIDTVDNPMPLNVTPARSSEITSRLFHVLQTTKPNVPKGSPGSTSVRILGTYLTADEADRAARNALRSKLEAISIFEQYDEQEWDDPTWRFGNDVIIHAVTLAGEDITVSVFEKPARNPLDVENLITKIC